MLRFVDNKWLAVLYIQILVDGKGLTDSYIQIWTACAHPGCGGGECPLYIYSSFVHNKGVAVLYIQILVDEKGLPRVYIQTGSGVVERVGTAGLVWAWRRVKTGPRRIGFAREGERKGAGTGCLEAGDFQEIAPANRARPTVALLFASVLIISCVSSFRCCADDPAHGDEAVMNWAPFDPGSHTVILQKLLSGPFPRLKRFSSFRHSEEGEETLYRKSNFCCIMYCSSEWNKENYAART